jgi:hypothetical protein
MLCALHIDEFDRQNIILSDKTKNNVLQKGDFYRIYYSDEDCCFNGVFIYFNLQNVVIEPYFNKIKCTFSKNLNKKNIHRLKLLEKEILVGLNLNKKPVYRIEEQLIQNFIKVFDDININNGISLDNINVYLKIAGIWSNEDQYGITFRFFFIHPLETT